MLKKMGWCLLTGSLLTPGLMAQEKPRELPGVEPIRPPAPVVPSNELPPLFVDTQVSQGSTYVDKWSFSADYLWWWMKRAPSPAPYVTTTRALGEGIPQEFAGSLGDPDTQSLVDDRNLNFGTFSGLRLRASAMGPLVGLDLGGFLLERRSGGDFIAADMPSSPTGTDGGFPFLARPFFDVNANRENAYFVSVPTFTSGSTRVSEQVAIFGYDVNATVRLACWDNVEIIAFWGIAFWA